MNPFVIASLAQTLWCGIVSGHASASAQEAVVRKPKTIYQLQLEELSKRAIIVRVPKTDK